MGRRLTVAAVSGDSSPSSAESSFRELDDVFLQNQTIIWLGEVLCTRMNDQLNISDLLADGELLSEVAKVVWTMLLAKSKELRLLKGHKNNPFGSRKSSGRYRPYSNVDSFLKICKILGLKSIDLFSPSDVVEKRNTRKVCMCIRSLSKKARSKQLKVPDFDNVTYTVAMPTDMVGCLRRSWELSQCSMFTANCTPCRDSMTKTREKKFTASHDSNAEFHSEASDEAESNYIGMTSSSFSPRHSYDSELQENSDSENSPEVSSMVMKPNSGLCGPKADVHNQGSNGCKLSDEESAAQTVSSIFLQHAKDDYQLNSMPFSCVDSELTSGADALYVNNQGSQGHGMGTVDLTNAEHGEQNYASIVENTMYDDTAERIYESHGLAFSDLLAFGNKDHFLFDGDDIMFNLLFNSDSHGSNSNRKAFQSGLGRRSDEDFDDVEVSSVASMSSIVGRVLNLDSDDQFDVDDLRVPKINHSDAQNYEPKSLDGSLMTGDEFEDSSEFGNSLQSLVPDAESSNFEEKHGKFSVCSDFSLPLWQSNSIKYQDVGSVDENCISQRNVDVWGLNNASCVPIDDAEVDDATLVGLEPISNEKLNGCLMASCNSNVIDERFVHSKAASDNFAEKESGPCCTDDFNGFQQEVMTIQDLNKQGKRSNQDVVHGNGDLNNVEDMAKEEKKHEHVNHLAEPLHEGKETVARCLQGKNKKLMLRRVAKGTAVIGVLFLLLHHLRRNGKEKTGEMRKRFGKIVREIDMDLPSRKEQQKAKGGGAYPAEKLKI